MEISEIEKEYIKLTYLSVTDYDDLEKELRRTKNKIIKMKERIFKVFSANSWHNVIRRSFELNILTKEDYRELNIEDEIIKTVKKIKKIKKSKYQDDENVKLEIFYSLVELYNKREYDLLLRTKNLTIVLPNQYENNQRKVS